MPQTRSLRSLVIGSAGRPADPGPPSPTLTEATNVSALNFGSDGPSKIITRNNLKQSLQAYENVRLDASLIHSQCAANTRHVRLQLINTCTNYRAALMSLSKATAAFADAMQTCSACVHPPH
jgi:hypothetical protein